MTDLLGKLERHGAAVIDLRFHAQYDAGRTERNSLGKKIRAPGRNRGDRRRGGHRYLGAYLKRSGAAVTSVTELLASGLYTPQLRTFLQGANAQPDDYLSSADYAKRLAARASLGNAIRAVMDQNRLDAILYPTARRIAPLIGGNQVGSNAGLSAQTGFPAISVPAGFTTGGFPVGVELLGRPFAEPTLIALAYSYEQATHHRCPPSTTPPLAS